jgi:hypothetical protein
MFEKILYFGACTHLEPISHFNKTKKFVFVDSQPRTEYGFEYYYRPFYRDTFLPRLFNKTKELNFNLIDTTKLTNNYEEINVPYLDPTLLYFSDKAGKNLRSERSLNYYISTGIPNDYYMNKSLRNDIMECDSIIVSGYMPNSCVLQYIKKPFHFIGYENTYFPKDLEENILNREAAYSITSEDVLSYILLYPEDVKSYTIVDNDGIKSTFNDYKNFYNLYNIYKQKLKE